MQVYIKIDRYIQNNSELKKKKQQEKTSMLRKHLGYPGRFHQAFEDRCKVAKDLHEN